MSTFNQMADEVTRKLAGYTLRQDRQTHLIADITASDGTIYVADATNVSVGIIQIDDELLYIDSFDRDNNKLIVGGYVDSSSTNLYGRGYNSTTAVAHTKGTRVIISPTYTAVDVKNAINETIHAVYPEIYATDQYSFTYRPARLTYELPSELKKIIMLSYESIGPSKQWIPIRSYRLDTAADRTSFPSGKTVSLYSGIVPGRRLNVHYSHIPSTMENGNDDFEYTTGLFASSKDVIILGAAARLAAFIDPGRLTFGSAEADQQSQIAGRAYGAGTAASKYLYALYQQRLQEEAQRYQDENNTRIHYSL
jgi:hypothetical protein